jgi:RNA polymerase sigma-19 factor, ECF subfamily
MVSEGTPYETKELLMKMAAGDEKAFDQLYRRFAPAIYSALMVYVKDEQQAEDLLQVTFVRFWQRRAAMQSVNCPEDYLFIIAKNSFINWWRKAVRERKGANQYANRLTLATSDIEDSLRGVECDRLFQVALDQLPDQQRLVYRMVSENELTYDEVAHKLQISKFTVKKHLELARRYIRNYMTHSGYANLTITYLLFSIFL